MTPARYSSCTRSPPRSGPSRRTTAGPPPPSPAFEVLRRHWGLGLELPGQGRQGLDRPRRSRPGCASRPRRPCTVRVGRTRGTATSGPRTWRPATPVLVLAHGLGLVGDGQSLQGPGTGPKGQLLQRLTSVTSLGCLGAPASNHGPAGPRWCWLCYQVIAARVGPGPGRVRRTGPLTLPDPLTTFHHTSRQ